MTAVPVRVHRINGEVKTVVGILRRRGASFAGRRAWRSGLTGDQQLQAGLFCGSQHPTLFAPLTSCAPQLYGSTLVQIPAPGKQDPDRNPQRIDPRHLFDVSIGHDNVFHGDKYQVSFQLTAINLTNKYALYNFLSTFSGTHYVTPRALTAQIGFHF